MKSSSILGKSNLISIEHSKKVIKALRGLGAFNPAEQVESGEMPLVVDWIVEKPVSLIGLELPTNSQLELSSIDDQDCGSLDSPIQALFEIGNDAFMSCDVKLNVVFEKILFKIKLVLCCGGRGLNGVYRITVYSISNDSDSAMNKHFLEYLANIFDISSIVSFYINENRVRFRLSCDADRALKLSFSPYGSKSDIAESMLSVSGLDSNQARLICDRLLSHSKLKSFPFRRYLAMVSRPEDFTTAASWMTQFYTGPWHQKYVGMSFLRVAGGEVLENLRQNDVIPLGILGATKKVKGLGRNGVYVDLFKEEEGWHVAFHYNEHEAGPKQRAAAIEAIHNMLGMRLIERTPETLWPHIFH